MISKHFSIEEFVPKLIFTKYGENSKWFIDERVIYLAEFVREWFKVPVTINNWHSGGSFQERGYRTPQSTTGASYSQHKTGRAIDFSVKGLTADQVRKEIMDYEYAFMVAGLTTLEDAAFAPTWVHADIRNTGLDTILIVKP